MKIEWIADVQRVYCILPEEGECTIGIAPLTNFEAVYGFLHELGHVATSPKGELLRTMSGKQIIECECKASAWAYRCLKSMHSESFLSYALDNIKSYCRFCQYMWTPDVVRYCEGMLRGDIENLPDFLFIRIYDPLPFLGPISELSRGYEGDPVE